MPSLTERSIIKFGNGGMCITIPITWARFYDLKPGDKLTLIVNGILKIKPKKILHTLK